jgi:hypothetical protein
MSTSELERRIARALHQDAEDAMARTDTRARLQDLDGVIERRARRRRVGWAAGAIATAAAAVAVFVATANPGDEPRSVTPAADPSATQSSAEPPAAVGVAAAFVDAFARYDLDRVESYLAEGANLTMWTRAPGSPDPWRRDVRWAKAVGFRMLPGSCAVLGEWVDGTAVRCGFAYYSLRSEELGRRPFPDNTFLLTVNENQIVAGQLNPAWATNGFNEYHARFAAWLVQTHPDDAPGMYANWHGAVPAENDEAIVLWAKYTREYVAAVRRGTAE